MSYSVIVTKSVQKQLDDLPAEFRLRVLIAIDQLKEEPRPNGVKKLKGAKNEYRVRLSDYRLRYKINDKELLILLIHCKHRSEVYRDL